MNNCRLIHRLKQISNISEHKDILEKKLVLELLQDSKSQPPPIPPGAPLDTSCVSCCKIKKQFSSNVTIYVNFVNQLVFSPLVEPFVTNILNAINNALLHLVEFLQCIKITPQICSLLGDLTLELKQFSSVLVGLAHFPPIPGLALLNAQDTLIHIGSIISGYIINIYSLGFQESILQCNKIKKLHGNKCCQTLKQIADLIPIIASFSTIVVPPDVLSIVIPIPDLICNFVRNLQTLVKTSEHNLTQPVCDILQIILVQLQFFVVVVPISNIPPIFLGTDFIIFHTLIDHLGNQVFASLYVLINNQKILQLINNH